MKLRYIVAQVVIVVYIALDWFRRGAYYGEQPDTFLGSLGSAFLFLVFITGLPAIVVCAIDGWAGRSQEGFTRQLLLTILVVGFAAFISWAGIFILVFEDLFDVLGHKSHSFIRRVADIIAVETIFLLEWGFAAWIRRRHGR